MILHVKPAIIFVIIDLTTQTIFKSSRLELKDRKVKFTKSNVVVEIREKQSMSLSLKTVKVRIRHLPAKMLMTNIN